MQAVTVSPLYSESFNRLRHYFYCIQPPYTLEHVSEFNTIYREIYPRLSREEKRRAEEFVDSLIDGLQRKEWAARIFGVV